ncbi:LuxR family transcriptional regulator [Streptomyces sp. NPDC051219]|uniref:LuxR family transcriptional regulator n=1 Tax=Streptomyces sp. NPDC051219 TaxID=3155283 RepID=UPI003424D3C9
MDTLAHVLEAPLWEIAERFSGALDVYIPHSALVIFTKECTGRPQKKAGDESIISRVTIGELEQLRARLPLTGVWRGSHRLGGAERPVIAWMATTGALLALTDPQLDEDHAGHMSVVDAMWQMVAMRIQQQVAAAPPSYLRESRAASAERARVTAEMTDAHATTLETVLAVLRSRDLDDARARRTATDLAAAAMVRLRTASDLDRSLAEEPVGKAFARLRDDLSPLMRFGDVEVQLVEPPADGRALPGEVAHAARAVVRAAVLGMAEQPGVRRVRTQWNCDGSNLLMNIRDDGPGALTAESLTVMQLRSRIHALNGLLTVQVTPGWGSELQVTLPLDPPAPTLDEMVKWGLAERELEVLKHIAAGQRNRSIAKSLGISENTVKFHTRNLFRKMGAASRAEAAALAHAAGL